MKRYAIVGASAAGLSCAKTLRTLDPDCEITLFTEEAYLPYSRPIISYYLKDKVSADRIYLQDAAFYEKNRITVRTNTRVAAVQTGTLTTEGGETYKFDKILLATGSVPFVPPMENVGAQENVFTFLTMRESERLKAFAKPTMHAVIIGAGLIGLKAAEGLRPLVESVTVVELADKVLPSILDDAAAKTVRAHLNANGVETLLGDTVVRAEGEDKITSVTLKSGKTLPCDLLVLAVGVRPNTALGESAGAQVNRGITVNHETMETTVPGIFAAGDCVRSYDILDGQEKIIALWPNAVREGATAAYNMAGCEHKDAGSFAVNAIDFFGLRICTCGLIRAEGATVLSREGENSGKRLLIKDNRLVGFVLLNASERAGIYTALIQNRVELNTLSGDLLDEPGLMLYARDIRTEKLTGGVRV